MNEHAKATTAGAPPITDATETNRLLTLFRERINQPPPEENIAVAETDDIDIETGKPITYKYIPISILNHMLDDIYDGLVQRIVLSVENHFNSSKAHVRLMVMHPVIGEWMAYDGVAAVPVVNIKEGPYKGSKIYENLLSENLAVPLVAAEAFKNAARQIGTYFGSDLNREENKTKNGREKIKQQNKTEAPIATIESETERLLAKAQKIKGGIKK
jgi:hypothetical protein